MTHIELFEALNFLLLMLDILPHSLLAQAHRGYIVSACPEVLARAVPSFACEISSN